jgi:uncharacterized protein (DUF2147 family)
MRIRSVLLLWLLAALPASATAQTQADPTIGLWRTQTDHGLVRIAPCTSPNGPTVCGFLVSSDKLLARPGLADIHNPNPALRARSLGGLQILAGFSRTATGWAQGTVYNPQDGRTYHARLTVIDPDHLRVRGCVFVPLCQTQTWSRATGG